MRYIIACLALLALPACEMREIETETGYKGRARANAWLAAERFLERYGYETRSIGSWRNPEWEDGTWFAPADSISNSTFADAAEEWIAGGGHMILIVDHAQAYTDDWALFAPPIEIPPPLEEFLGNAGIVLEEKRVEAQEITFEDGSYEVDAEASYSVRDVAEDDEPGVFASVRYGDGRLTVVTDGRIFRNRWIGEKQHAALLLALLNATEYAGDLVFVRGTGLSIWLLLGQRLWPLLVGLAVLVILWLWKNFSRFGPLEPAQAPSNLRAYDHHLEALGDFQWRLDRAKSLLLPLRERVVERGQQLAVSSGHRDGDFFQLLATRAGIPRDRVFRALAEPAPADAAVLARTAADLQRLLHCLS